MPRKADTQQAREPAQRPRVPCAHETCTVPARCRVLTATGWADLCEPHYVRHFDEIARKRFIELGLDRGMNESREDHRKRVMAHIKGPMKAKTFNDATKAEDEWAKTAEA